MAGKNNLAAELSSVKYRTFPEITRKINELSEQYGGLPMSSIINAFGGMYDPNPYTQNRRVKEISSPTNTYTKKQIEDFLKAPGENEIQLRRQTHEMEYTAYPFLHMREVYQNLLTYHSYVAPYLTNDGDSKKEDFWREWKLLEKVRTAFNVKQVAHEIAGQAIQEGKVFYIPRYSVDKAHNKVNHAFLQQLPSDYTKIVGYNNKSKYTIAFDLMYFTKPGTDIYQFGDLFLPYINAFESSIVPPPKGTGTKIIYATKSGINFNAVTDERAEVYYQNGRWFYWVTLPVDRVFTFEVDDVPRTAVSPFTGLLTDMMQLSKLSELQLELLSNPLIAILTGQIPFYNSKDSNIADQYMLSNAARLLFLDFWDQMCAKYNTGGVGIYAAPFENMKLETLPEAPNATNIVSSGYQDVMNKAGLSGIIPTADDTRAGTAQISFVVESQFSQPIYRCMERMMNVIIESLNLKYDWRFYMFGDLPSEEKLREETKKDMTLGILPATIIYNALYDRSILEDISWSQAVKESGVLETRYPLVSSYNVSPDAQLPPVGQIDESEAPTEEGGRPRGDGTGSDGGEQDMDSYGESRFMV